MQTTQAKRKHFSKALFLCVPIVVVSLAGAFTQSAKRKQNDPVASSRSAFAAAAPPFTLSHAFIVVTTGAPERRALEKAGFRIAPTVSRHDGQGTASVTVELLNGFLELIYPDATVPVSVVARRVNSTVRRLLLFKAQTAHGFCRRVKSSEAITKNGRG